MSLRRGSGSSKKIAFIRSSRQGKTSSKPKGNTTIKFASRRAQEKYRADCAAEQQLRMEYLEPSNLKALGVIRDYNTTDFMNDDSDTLNVNDVLEGNSAAEISHGGEFQDAIAAEMEAERQKRNQMGGLVEMYSVWVGKGERACTAPVV
ncbi:hypothetical protein B0H17DRAFT_1147526 [Mycena rosella]|uniref:Uncharacterized protein n=1 Tax=Mycena rosella TaxID=1033263 RepID=A0AAD7CM56_MYCRO|nr:hypothetical protein B0H17DRAFT_1147526 [Mycena rosella]